MRLSLILFTKLLIMLLSIQAQAGLPIKAYFFRTWATMRKGSTMPIWVVKKV